MSIVVIPSQADERARPAPARHRKRPDEARPKVSESGGRGAGWAIPLYVETRPAPFKQRRTATGIACLPVDRGCDPVVLAWPWKWLGAGDQAIRAEESSVCPNMIRGHIVLGMPAFCDPIGSGFASQIGVGTPVTVFAALVQSGMLELFSSRFAGRTFFTWG